jgi:hypothetical protein
MNTDRRRFLLGSVQVAAWYALFQLAERTSAWAKGIKPVVRRWAEQLAEICRAVRAGELAPIEWQKSIERLHSTIPLQEIITFVEVDEVIKRIRFPAEKLGAVEDTPWPSIGGIPASDFGHKVFVYRKGSATPPHAHNHLVSAHLTLRGEIRARTFDRLEDLDHSILIQASGDRLVGPGQTVSMSDARDNVHWFVGVSDRSVSFDVPVGAIDPQKQYRHPPEVYSQIYLDPTVAARADGRIEAPIIPFRESVRRFG